MKKKILAFLCLVSVLVSAVFAGFPNIAKGTEVKAAETVATSENASKDLTYVTLKDINVMDGATSMSTTAYSPGWNNTVMQFYANIKSSGVRMHLGNYAADGGWRAGIIILFGDSKLTVTNDSYCFQGDADKRLDFEPIEVQASEYGFGDSFLNQKLLYQLQTEYIDNDIHFSLTIENKKVASVVIEDQVSKMGDAFRICDGDMELYSVYPEYDYWTYDEVGGTDGELPSIGGTTELFGSLDDTFFQAKMTFPEGSFGNVYIGSGDWYGIVITSGADNGLKFQTVATQGGTQDLGIVTEAIAGQLRNKELNIGISVRFWGVDTSTQMGYVEVGVWLNGVLYNNEYFMTPSPVKVSDFTKRVHTYLVSGVNIVSVASPKQNEVPEDFTRYTVSDTNPVYNFHQITDSTIPGTTLDKMMFMANVSYTGDSQQFHYATDSGNYGGFSFYPSNSMTDITYTKVLGNIPNSWNVTIPAQKAIGRADFSSEFTVWVTTEYVDCDFDGLKDDVKLGLWFNRVLYNAQYFYHIDARDYVGTRIVTNEGGSPKFTDAIEKLPEYTNDYDSWSYKDVKVNDTSFSNGWNYTTITSDTLDQTYFQGYVTFKANDYVFLGSTRDYYGIGFECYSDGTLGFGLFDSSVSKWHITQTASISPSDYGYESFHDQKIKLGIATKLLKNNNNGTFDVEVFALVNDQIVGNRPYTLTVKATRYNRSMALQSSAGMAIESIDCVSNANAFPEGLTTVNMNDLGLADTVTDWASGSMVFYEKGSFDNTIIPLKINYGGMTPIIRFGQNATSVYSGIGLNWTGTKLEVGGNSGTGELNIADLKTTVTPDDPTAFANKELSMDIVIQYIDMDYDGAEDDLKYGVYLEGELVGGSYFYAFDVVQYLGAGIGVQNASIASISTGGHTTKTLDKSAYTSYTLIDAGIADGIGTIYGKLRDANGNEITGTGFDKVLFGAKVKFNTTSARMHYAAMSTSQFSGMQLRLLDDGNLVVEQYADKNLSYRTVIVKAEDYLENGTFAGQEILVQWTTDIREINGNTEEAEVLVGLWINGKLVNDAYILCEDAASKLECNINFNEGTDTQYYSLWNIEAPSNEGTLYYKLTDDNPYLVIADTFTDAAGNTYTNGSVVTVSGEYTATYNAVDEYLQATTQKVVLWKEWDVSADGVLNAKDLVALKKVAAGNEPATEAACMALSKIDSAARIVDYRKYLVGSFVLPTDGLGTLNYQSDEDGLVFPIGSWVGPSTWNGYNSTTGEYLSDYGLESNFLQTKYYDMIEELGINKLTYVSTDYDEVSERTLLKGLSMAEEYGLQVYVEDTAIAYDVTDEKIVAERANKYGRYSSFAGINVYDEPKTNGIYYASSVEEDSHLYIKDIKNKASLLNSYTNLMGYVNLYPDRKSINYKKYYPAYLNEYIESCNPKELSYDDYPFSRDETVENSRYYFSNLGLIREAALNAGIPFIGYIGTGENYEIGAQTTNNIYPTSEQLKWNVNTLLAYGAKGYNWFTLIEPWYFALKGTSEETTGLDANRSGLIGVTGEKTRHYDTAVAINNWVLEIDHILMESTSKKILATGTKAKNNTGFNQNSYNGVTVTAENTEYGAIVGVFDYKGKSVYYVVNNYVKIGSDGKNKGAASQKITLNFGSTAKTCTVYNGNNLGSSETGTSLELDIEAGGAALVVVD